MTYYNVKPHEAYAANVANLANIQIWVPALGNRFVLNGCSISASVAGRYQLYDGSNLIWDGILAANTPFVIPLGAEDVYTSTTINQALTLLNATGVAANMSGTAFGVEQSF